MSTQMDDVRMAESGSDEVMEISNEADSAVVSDGSSSVASKDSAKRGSDSEVDQNPAKKSKTAVEQDTTEEMDKSFSSKVSETGTETEAAFPSVEANETKAVAKSEEEHHVVDDVEKDVLNMVELQSMAEKSKHAQNTFANENLFLMVGSTGAGKTTLAHFLAGNQFEYDDDDDDDDVCFRPVNKRDDMSDFITSDSTISVTKAIHVVKLTTQSGKSVLLADSPGFGDTKGVEVEIRNNLMIVGALKQARKIKLLFVVDAAGMKASRCSTLVKTLRMILAMFGDGPIDFSALEYIWNRSKKAAAVLKRLKAFRQDLETDPEGVLGEDFALADVVKRMVDDMIEKTSQNAHIINLRKCENSSEVLENLCKSDNFLSPDAFANFVSPQAINKLELQTNRMVTRIERNLAKGSMEAAETLLDQISSLSSAISLPVVSSAVESGRAKVRDYVRGIRSGGNALVSRIIKNKGDEVEFRSLLVELRAELLILSNMASLCNSCQLSNEETYQGYVCVVMNNIFGSIHSALESISIDNAIQNAGVLKSGLSQSRLVGRVLGDLPQTDSVAFERNVTKVKRTVLAVIKEMFEDLDETEQVSPALVKDWSQKIVFAREMDKFIEGLDGVVCVDLDGIRERILSILKKVKATGDSSLSHLRDIDTKVQNIDYADLDASQSLVKQLASEKISSARRFTLSLLDSQAFLDATYNSVQSLQSLAAVVDSFDAAVNSFVERTAKHLEDSANNLVHSLDKEACQEQIQLADSVSEAVEAIDQYFSSRQMSAEDCLEGIKGVVNLCNHIKDETAWPGFSLKTLRNETICEKRVDLESALHDAAEVRTKITAWDEAPSLSDEQIKSFDAFGFNLSKFKAKDQFSRETLGRTFYTNWNSLQEYMKSNDGDSYVNKSDDADLQKWTETQRKEYAAMKQGKQYSLTSEQEDALDHIKFNWKIRTRDDIFWDNKIKELLAFKEETGHCLVPQRSRKFKSLGMWVNNVREKRKGKRGGKLSPARIQQLDSLDFVWDARK